MEDTERLNLEFERINRKLDMIFDIMNRLYSDFEMKDYKEDLKDAEDKAKLSNMDVEMKRESRRWLEERESSRRSSWYEIERSIAARCRDMER